MHATVDAVFDDADVAALVADFVAEIAPAGWSNCAVGQAAAAHRPRRPRRLPGLRAVGDIPRRPRQPAPRRLRRATTDAGRAGRRIRPGRAARRRCDGGREAAGHLARAAAAARPPRAVHAVHADDGRRRGIRSRDRVRPRRRAHRRDPAAGRPRQRAAGGATRCCCATPDRRSTCSPAARSTAPTIRLDELLATYPVALLVPATAGRDPR